MPNTTNAKQVKMNIMTQAQYDAATKNPTELYMITDASMSEVENINTAHTFYAWRQLFDQVTIVYTTVPYTEGLEELKVYNSNFQEIVPDDPTENYFHNNQLWYQNEDGTSFYCSRLVESDRVINPIKQWTGTREQYDAVVTKDDGTFYTLVDEGKVYLGEIQLGNSGGSGGGNCFPSSTYDSLTVGASGTTYTAPADGWFVSYMIPGWASDALGLSTSKVNSLVQAGGVNAHLAVYIPVSAQDVVTLTYVSTQNATPSYLRFYYANSSVSS